MADWAVLVTWEAWDLFGDPPTMEIVTTESHLDDVGDEYAILEVVAWFGDGDSFYHPGGYVEGAIAYARTWLDHRGVTYTARTDENQTFAVFYPEIPYKEFKMKEESLIE